MARSIHQLSARTAETAGVGKHSDGGGLYLVVKPDGTRAWRFIYTFAGKRREAGLGAAGKGALSLADARTRAQEARTQLAAGIDPIEARRAARSAKAVPATFGQVADQYIAEAVAPALRNAKHAAQWATTLGGTPYDVRRIRSGVREHARHRTALEALRSKPVDAVTVEDVLAVLTPLWKIAPETASRVRGRIERVLDAARAKGLRTGENPARWRGHLDHLLPARQRLSRGHHKALPYQQMPQFYAALLEKQDASSLLLRFIVLTACRTGEARLASWEELDLERRVWTIGAGRMKAGRAHRVPLTDETLAVIAKLAELRVDTSPNALLFPAKTGRALSEMAPTMALRRLAKSWQGNGEAPWAGVTVHGFRSAFRDWVGEETTFQRELAEAALAHVVGDDTERAYRRGDALEKRRELMGSWADYCKAAESLNVVRLDSRRKGK